MQKLKRFKNLKTSWNKFEKDFQKLEWKHNRMSMWRKRPGPEEQLEAKSALLSRSEASQSQLDFAELGAIPKNTIIKDDSGSPDGQLWLRR